MLLRKISLSVILSMLLLCSGCQKNTVSPAVKNPDISPWVVDWDLKRGLDEIKSVPDAFKSVQIFGAYFDKDEKLFVPENLKELINKPIDELNKQGLKNIYITVVNDIVLEEGKSLEKDSKLIEDIIKDEKKRKAHIEELVNLAESGEFKGLTLDYEKIPLEVFDEYAAFIDELGSRLKKNGKNLRIVLEPSSPIDSVKLPRQYEYTMMAYNLYDTNTVPGPKADKKMIASLSDKMNKNFDNVRIAFSLGGFDWPEKGESTMVTQLEAEELLSKTGSLKKRYNDSEAVYFNYTDKDGIKHTVCYADGQTLLFWTKVALDKGISNFDIWRLGGNSIDTLSAIKDYAASEITMESSVKEVYPETNNELTKSNVVPSVLTGRKILSLTFNGLPDEEETGKILDELDALNIKATFFISGVKAAEEQEAARMIVERGHELGNSTLSGADLTKIDYDEKVREISKSHDAILKYTGIEPKYLRPGYGALNEEVCLAAASCGYEDIVTYSVNPQDWNSKTPEEVAKLVIDKKKRGGIIILNADKNPLVHEAIPLIYEGLKEKGYELVPLWQLIEINNDNKQNQYVPGSGDVKVDTEYKNTQYRIFEEGPAGKMQVALTFDDWGSDDTIDGLLDILDKYKVKATFFLRAKGVESNPSLALAISERGHEIANHTYSHTDLDLMTPMEVQEDIVKAHDVIASAINKEPARYMRPPRGVYNPKVAEAVAACGYRDIIMYSSTAYDWDPTTTAQDISSHMLNSAFDGDILLLHMLDNINTTKALPAIIEGLQAKGYNLVTVGEMLN